MPNDATPTTPAQSGETPGGGETPQPQDNLNFDAWLATQQEPIKKLIDDHTGGLRSALDTERTQRKDLAKQIRDLTGKLDVNSDAAKQLTTLSGSLEAAQQRADFYEALGPGCTNPKLAWLAFQADELKTIDQLRTAYPQLFATPKPPPHNGGNGTGQQPGAEASMNNFIRQAAGVRT